MMGRREGSVGLDLAKQLRKVYCKMRDKSGGSDDPSFLAL